MDRNLEIEFAVSAGEGTLLAHGCFPIDDDGDAMDDAFDAAGLSEEMLKQPGFTITIGTRERE